MKSSSDSQTVGWAPDIEHRRLSRYEAYQLVEEIRSSRTITGYSVAEWTRLRDCYVALDPRTGNLVGAVLVHHLVAGWSEVAVVYVRDAYRRRGVGSQMLERCSKDLRGKGRKLLIFFCEEQMKRIVTSVGFQPLGGEEGFSRGSVFRSLFIRAIYPALWRMSIYRNTEIRRKTLLYGADFEFELATLES